MVLHPAYILRGQWKHEPAQILYLRRLAEGSIGGPTEGSPPLARLDAPAGALRELRGRALALDIETAGPLLRCVGAAPLDDPDRAVVVHFYRRGGAKDRDYDEKLAALAELLADPMTPKVFHNGQAFDIPWLEENLGLRVEGYAGDTILMAHAAYPEMPKSLGFLANVYLGLYGWKRIPEPDESK